MKESLCLFQCLLASALTRCQLIQLKSQRTQRMHTCVSKLLACCRSWAQPVLPVFAAMPDPRSVVVQPKEGFRCGGQFEFWGILYLVDIWG